MLVVFGWLMVCQGDLVFKLDSDRIIMCRFLSLIIEYFYFVFLVLFNIRGEYIEYIGEFLFYQFFLIEDNQYLFIYLEIKYLFIFEREVGFIYILCLFDVFK